jgi:threonyl-tRNA synthetase
MEFRLKSNGGEIKKLERKSSNYLKSNGYSDEVIETQILILKELIISSKEFDDPSASEFEMSVQFHIEDNAITVEVKKPVCESDYGKLEELDKTIQWIRGYQDPLEQYMTNLAEASAVSHIAETNGLGLARIAHESDAIIDFYVNEDNVLNLSAVSNLPAEELNQRPPAELAV